MSLYFAFSKNISLRNSVPIFIIKDQKVSIKDECGVIDDLFPYLKEDEVLINDLLSYSNVNSLPSFEILINEKFELEKNAETINLNLNLKRILQENKTKNQYPL